MMYGLKQHKERNSMEMLGQVHALFLILLSLKQCVGGLIYIRTFWIRELMEFGMM